MVSLRRGNAGFFLIRASDYGVRVAGCPELLRAAHNAAMSLEILVALIGAGPGDAGLLTLRGAELLGQADVVLYDGLCNTDLLEHAGSAELVCVGKHGQSRIWRQEEINAELIRHARAGRRVARLKGGDPAVFARTAEEVEALQGAGIEFEIVPGITAALAAGSYAGIPITHRRIASAVALLTGHEEPGKSASAIDWNAIARFPGTLVIYMGVTRVASWTTALIAAGKDPDTPAAIVRRCSLPDQQVVQCRLGDVAEKLTPASRMRPPVITIVGPVTDLAATMSWFDRRPLFGQTVLVTRPAEQADALADPLRALGARVLIQPAIEIDSPADWRAVDDAIARLHDFSDVIFCSRNGVDYFCRRLLQTGKDVRRLANNRIAVVGKQTAAALTDYGLRCDLVPEDFNADSLADDLLASGVSGRVLIIRASRGKDVLAEKLMSAGVRVEQVAAYRHTDVQRLRAPVREAMAQSRIDWVTVTSSATAANLSRLLGDLLQQCRIASLSPITSAALRELGCKVDAEADPFTMKSLVDAIVRATHS